LRSSNSQGADPPRLDVLGTGTSAINPADALETIDGWIQRRERRYVCVANVHSVMEAHRNPVLRKVMNGSGLTTPDGMPLVWLLRHAGHTNASRVYGPDLMLDVCRYSVAAGRRHFFLGGGDGVADTMAERLCSRFPGLQVAGILSPPFRPLTLEEDEAVVESVNAASPDIVWVGLGAPKQELWMAEHRSRLDAPVLVGVGAAFDFHAGTVAQAPALLQRAGLEWAFRLVKEPRRLWYRYLVYNPWFVALVALQHRQNRNADRVPAGQSSDPSAD
jgi:N-acetylglucosaminyldiphosphoundecaprenol N-acetyl-beta-D-mannosaminyltransferase